VYEFYRADTLHNGKKKLSNNAYQWRGRHQVLTFVGRRTESQKWWFGKVNGKPGAGYNLNPHHHAFSTADRAVTFECWRKGWNEIWERQPSAPPAPPQSCSPFLRAEVDVPSYPTDLRTRWELELSRVAHERLFNSVADRMCAAGELKPRDIGKFEKLLIRSDPSWGSSALYTDSKTLGAKTLVLKAENVVRGYEEDDVRQALLCYFVRDADDEMCIVRKR
jgi:hypothetical protein